MQASQESSLNLYRTNHKRHFQKLRIEEIFSKVILIDATLKQLTVLPCSFRDFVAEISPTPPYTRYCSDIEFIIIKIKKELASIKIIMTTLCQTTWSTLLVDSWEHKFQKIDRLLAKYYPKRQSIKKYELYNRIQNQIQILMDQANDFINALKLEIKTTLDAINIDVNELLNGLPEEFLKVYLGKTNFETSHPKNYNDRLFLDLPQELLILVLTFMKGPEVVNFGMVARIYSLITQDETLWKMLFKQEFANYYPGLELLSKYQKINWKEKYKLACKIPYLSSFLKDQDPPAYRGDLMIPVKSGDTVEVLDLVVKYGAIVNETHLAAAAELKNTPFLLEILLAAINEGEEKTQLKNTALQIACAKNNPTSVAVLIAAGADVDCEFEDSYLDDMLRPLHYAIQYGDYMLVKMLLDAGVQIIAPNKYPLFHFLIQNHQNFSELKEYNFFYPKDFNQSYLNEIPFVVGKELSALEHALLHACQKNETIYLEWLFENGADPCSLVRNGQHVMPILHSVYKSYGSYLYPAQVIKKLLEFKINLEQKDSEGYTALHYVVAKFPALEKGVRIISDLIDAGADLSTINDSGQTLLHTLLKRTKEWRNFFEDNEHLAFLKTLLNDKVIHLPNKEGVTPLDLAKDNFLVLHSMILSKILPANACGESQNNILHVFAQYVPGRNYSEKKYNTKITPLIKAGADLNQVNSFDETPLRIAVAIDNYLAAWCLIANGAKIDTFTYKIAKGKTKNLLICARAVEQLIREITKKTFLPHLFSLSARINFQTIIREACFSNNPLAGELLLNHLRDSKLTLFQKERLHDQLLLEADCFEISFLQEIILLAREGRDLQLPAAKIIQLLEKFILILEKISSPIYESLLLSARETLKQYHCQGGVTP